MLEVNLKLDNFGQDAHFLQNMHVLVWSLYIILRFFD